MKLRFAYLKIVTSNQRIVTFGTAVTANRESDGWDIQPLGGTSLTAPSTVLVDTKDRTQYYLNKPYSAVDIAISAASTTQSINLV